MEGGSAVNHMCIEILKIYTNYLRFDVHSWLI